MTGSGIFHGAGGGGSLRGAGGGGGLGGAGGGETHGAARPFAHSSHGYGYGYYGGYYGGGYYSYPAQPAQLTVAQALAQFAANPSSPIAVTDTGAAVAGNLDSLEKIQAAHDLNGITLTD